MNWPTDEGAPYPDRDIVGWVRWHLPKAIEFAERDIAQVKASAEYWSRIYAERDLCPVGHVPSTSTEPCGYCESARKVQP